VAPNSSLSDSASAGMVFSIAVTFGNVFFSSAVNLNSVVFLIAVTLGNQLL